MHVKSACPQHAPRRNTRPAAHLVHAGLDNAKLALAESLVQRNVAVVKLPAAALQACSNGLGVIVDRTPQARHNACRGEHGKEAEGKGKKGR